MRRRCRILWPALLLLLLPALLFAPPAPSARAEGPEVRATRCECGDGERLTYQANADGSPYINYLLQVELWQQTGQGACYAQCLQACGCDPDELDLAKCSYPCIIGPLPEATKTTRTPTPAQPTWPCPEPGIFYPGIDLNGYFTGASPLAVTRAQLVHQIGQALQAYADAGNKVSGGVGVDDVYQIAITLRSDTSSLPTGREATLRDAARALARKKQKNDPAYRVSPGELFALSIKANKGNVRDALLTCHAVLFRDGAKVNKKFVEQEGVLASLRDPAGYVDGAWTYVKPSGTNQTINPRRDLGHEEQGPWYHLFGLAALEYTDMYGEAGYEAALYATMHGWFGLDPAMIKNGVPASGLGGKLGDLAIAIENGIRTNQGKPPDLVKHCFNYTGLAVGTELKRITGQVVQQNSYSSPGGLNQSGDILHPDGTVTFRSPLSLRVVGSKGEWFTFDQVTGRVDGNTAAIYFTAFREDDATWGVVVAPLFEVAGMTLTATSGGPVTLGLYDSATRASGVYEFSAERGDVVEVGSLADTPRRNGVPLPASYREGGGGDPLQLWLMTSGIVVLLAAASFLAWRVAAARRRKVVGPGGPAPAAQPSTVCPRCGLVQPATVPSCRGCGLPHPPGAATPGA